MYRSFILSSTINFIFIVQINGFGERIRGKGSVGEICLHDERTGREESPPLTGRIGGRPAGPGDDRWEDAEQQQR